MKAMALLLTGWIRQRKIPAQLAGCAGIFTVKPAKAGLKLVLLLPEGRINNLFIVEIYVWK